MDNETNFFEESSIDKNLEITGQSRAFLSETAKWTKFLSVIGFVGIGLMVLGGIFGAAALSKLNSIGGGGGVPPLFYTIIYLVMAALYFLPVRYMWLFSTKMETGLKSNIQAEIDSAFENMKSHFKYMGIMMIVVLSIYVLLIVVAIFANVVARM